MPDMAGRRRRHVLLAPPLAFDVRTRGLRSFAPCVQSRMHGGCGQASQGIMDTHFQLDLESTQPFFDPMSSTDTISGQNCVLPCDGNEGIEEIDGEQFADGTANKKGSSHRGKSFLPQEDRVIVSGWLNISKDASIGASQTSNAFYARLHCYFLENWDLQSLRSQVSIQNRWTAIRKAVSKFQGILFAVQRRNESGKTDQDKLNDAIRVYEEKKPWQFSHCWEILRSEPKWNDYLLECSKPKHGNEKQPAAPAANPANATMPTAPIERLAGRDSVKRHRSTVEDTPSSVAVEMLQKIHARGQQLDEEEAKQKVELVAIERAKLDLQQCAVLAKIDQGDKMLQLQREIMEANRFQIETQIMFTDLNAMQPATRYWMIKKQRDILIREGINPDEVESCYPERSPLGQQLELCCLVPK